MILIISILLLFLNFVSFYISNLNYLEKSLTNREKRNRNKNKNIFVRIFFLDSWSVSNKVYWCCNFFNIIIAVIGIICFFINLFLKNSVFEEIVGTILLIVFVVVALFVLISKLIINIKDNNSIFSKFVLALVLILYIIGMISIVVSIFEIII